ncbi:MAG: hypothetical protein JKY94_12915 [Rhodobacteraceae bacterium]|nr:hypothetical protein [Paracoccaceae bacterium]
MILYRQIIQPKKPVGTGNNRKMGIFGANHWMYIWLPPEAKSPHIVNDIQKFTWHVCHNYVADRKNKNPHGDTNDGAENSISTSYNM